MSAASQTKGLWVLALFLEFTAAACVTHQRAVRSTREELPFQKIHSQTDTFPRESTTNAAPLQVSYIKLPLHFEPNQGQTAEQVHFLTRSSCYTFILTSTTGSQEPLTWRAV